jgi:hypothetical protein
MARGSTIIVISLACFFTFVKSLPRFRLDGAPAGRKLGIRSNVKSDALRMPPM